MKFKFSFSVFLLLLFSSALIAQDKDKFYLEDQIYVSTTYNMLLNKNDSISQGGFSNGFEFGYMRDIPFNSQRNIGIAIGVGYSIGHFYQNLDIRTLADGSSEISRLDSKDFIRNKFTLSSVEIPFEIRYRTSTAEKHDFFRLYLGVKAGYKINVYSKKKTNLQEIAYYNNPEFNKWRYGLTLRLGYSSWNFYMYYGLNNVFKDGAEAEAKDLINPSIPLKMNEVNVGLVFFLI